MSSLLNFGYPVVPIGEFPGQIPYAFEIFGLPVVLFRGNDDSILCLQDRCSHRSVPLSIGKIEDGAIECRYHGWSFGKDGKCVKLPVLEPGCAIPITTSVPSYPALEHDGLIWIWPGDSSLAKESLLPPKISERDDSNWKCYEHYIDIDASFQSIMQNLFDTTHIRQFQKTHTQLCLMCTYQHKLQQGVGMPVLQRTCSGAIIPTSIQPQNYGGFKAKFKCAGDEVLDITTEFQPPCCVRTEVLLKGTNRRTHQVHYVTPLRSNKCRVFLRHLRNYLLWIPNCLFASSIYSIIRKEMAVLMTQRLRLVQGADPWNQPAETDDAALRFQRWYEQCEKFNPAWFVSFNRTYPPQSSVNRSSVVDIEDFAAVHQRCCCTCASRLIPQGCSHIQTIESVQRLAPYVWPASHTCILWFVLYCCLNYIISLKCRSP